MKLQTPLIKVRKSGKQYVTKKDLKKVEPQSKEFLLKFTEKHPEVLEEFKKQRNTKSLRNTEIRDINIKDVCEILGAKLVQISTGNNNASAFHNIILGILEPIFYPTLINPVKGREIHDGRKRIDITFDNAAEDGIFYRLPENMNLPCPFIFIECKNYSSDPANPELDKLSGRFSGNRGRVGLLICRTFSNRDQFIARCRDTFKDGRGLIIPLADQDVINL